MKRCIIPGRLRKVSVGNMEEVWLNIQGVSQPDCHTLGSDSGGYFE